MNPWEDASNILFIPMGLWDLLRMSTSSHSRIDFLLISVLVLYIGMLVIEGPSPLLQSFLLSYNSPSLFGGETLSVLRVGKDGLLIISVLPLLQGSGHLLFVPVRITMVNYFQ